MIKRPTRELFFRFLLFSACIGSMIQAPGVRAEEKQQYSAPEISSESAAGPGTEAAPAEEPARGKPDTRDAKRYFGHRISLDFQDAGIRNVFRLISEVSGVNIVAGEDVKGSVSVHMRNVPWDQALETILDTNGLGMKRTGTVIAVFPLEKIKKAEEERLKEDIAQGRKTQISIEAKIVEATSNYARRLGVQWGAAINSASNFWLRTSGGIMPPKLTPLPGGIGVVRNTIGADTFGTSYLVNLAHSYAVSPGIGLLIGGADRMLDAQISALEGTGEVKVISSPKVTTLDNVKALIKQGQAIPIITRGTTTEPPKTEYKDAVLQLTVTPTVTPDGRLSLKILATNDAADYATQTAQKLDNPPINKSEVESTVLVHDGETVVVGGIRKSTESKGETGVPWLSRVPVLGWLFKSQEIEKDQREMLIFITPKIIPHKLTTATLKRK
jgi:type IV pilus assembly protein PilQ